MASSSTGEFNKVQERLQSAEIQKDVEFIQDIIEKINGEVIDIDIDNKFGTLLCDPSKIPEVTACLSKFVNDNK